MGFGGRCRFCLILGLMRWLGLGEDRISEFLEFQYVGPQMSRMAQMGFGGIFFGAGVMYGLGAWKDAATVGHDWIILCFSYLCSSA